MNKFIWIVLLLVLVACMPNRENPDRAIIPSPINPSASPTTELPLEATPMATRPCGYQWANQSLPEVSEQFQQAFDSAGMSGITIRAEAFGENCLNADGSVQRFLPMQTDLFLAVTVGELSPETIGSQIEQIMPIIQQIPTDTLPGPGSATAYLTFEFTANDEKIRFRVQRPQILEALQADKHGAKLYEALRP